jgi:hypothetical protein
MRDQWDHSAEALGDLRTYHRQREVSHVPSTDELGHYVTALTALALALVVLVMTVGRYLRIERRVRREMREEARLKAAAQARPKRKPVGFQPPQSPSVP